jgi:hypothetical protein
LAKDLDMFRLGAIATRGRMIPSDNLSFAKKNFVGLDVWEFNQEGLGSFWLKTSATLGGDTLTEGLNDWG